MRKRGMNRVNYQRQLEKILDGIEADGTKPRLLLHGCCAPCSSYVLEYLSEYFEITELFYNPNIYPEEEYSFRSGELERLVDEMEISEHVNVIVEDYNPEEFFDIASGLEDCPEGGERCFKCYELRMRRAAQTAKEGGFDWFCTTLSISPLKNAEKINEIGEKLEKEYGVKFLPSDFKKKDGYKRSVELSGEYDLYRQNYCGCKYSKKD